jgi:RNA polymerase sigma-70 factor, ECF subfamily
MATEINIKDLIEGCIQGNRRSQEMLHKFYYGKMMVVCLRYISDHDAAKDALQEGFIKIYNNLDKYDFTGSFESWVKRIFINTSIDFYRKNKSLQNVFNQNVEIENLQERIDDKSLETPFTNLCAPDILEAVQSLSPVYRTVFNMYAIDGFNHYQIAAELNISVGTSKSNYSKAKHNLQKILTKKLEICNETN